MNHRVFSMISITKSSENNCITFAIYSIIATIVVMKKRDSFISHQ